MLSMLSNARRAAAFARSAVVSRQFSNKGDVRSPIPLSNLIDRLNEHDGVDIDAGKVSLCPTF